MKVLSHKSAYIFFLDMQTAVIDLYKDIFCFLNIYLSFQYLLQIFSDNA